MTEDVKTARDVLDECKMSAAYNDARPHEESGLLIAALAEAGYEINRGRADDGVRVEAAARTLFDHAMPVAVGSQGQWDRINEEYRDVFRARARVILAAADAVAGAGREADARELLEQTVFRVIDEWIAHSQQPIQGNIRLLRQNMREEVAALAPAAGEVRS